MAFVVSSGQLRAVEAPPPFPGYAIRISDERTADYAALWRAQPELRTVVDFLARNIAQLGLHVFRRVSDVDRQRLAGHPLAALLDRPNPSTTRYRLIDALVHDMAVFDDAFWLKARAEGGEPVSLWRVPPQRMMPVGGWTDADGYTIFGSRGHLDVDASQVVHFRGYNPIDGRRGTSPIESLRQILAEEWSANVYREQLWRNGARMSGYVKRPLEAPNWGPKGRQRFKDEWQADYAGDSDTAGGVAILDDGMDFVPAAVTPRDSQYIESRKLTREEVARSFHVPLPLVGILDHATFSNIREQHKNLYQDCLGPWLEMISQEIELQLLPDLPDTAGIYVEFNVYEKLRGSFEEQAAQLQASVGAPYMTRNEARARLNLPQVDGGDELVLPLNVALGTGAPTTAPDDSAEPKRVRMRVKARAPQGTADKATEVLQRFFRRQGQAVASAVGASKSAMSKAEPGDVFDTARWDAELSADLLRINQSVAEQAARATIEDLDLDPDDFDTDLMLGWLAANASGVASAVNATTAARVGEALDADDPLDALKTLFEGYVAARAAQLATTQTTSISGFGTVEAAKQAGGDEATKTWVAGANARPTHAAVNGETVGLHDTFSNGARWPADINLSVDEIAGCNCALIVTA